MSLLWFIITLVELFTGKATSITSQWANNETTNQNLSVSSRLIDAFGSTLIQSLPRICFQLLARFLVGGELIAALEMNKKCPDDCLQLVPNSFDENPRLLLSNTLANSCTSMIYNLTSWRADTFFQSSQIGNAWPGKWCSTKVDGLINALERDKRSEKREKFHYQSWVPTQLSESIVWRNNSHWFPGNEIRIPVKVHWLIFPRKLKPLKRKKEGGKERKKERKKERRRERKKEREISLSVSPRNWIHTKSFFVLLFCCSFI